MENIKLDKLIAEKVMDWKVEEFPNINVVIAITEEDELNIPEEYHPTRNMDQAWDVVKELRLKEIYISINTSGCRVEASVYETDSTPPYSYKRTIASEQCESIEMSDMPLKICQVALKALEARTA